CGSLFFFQAEDGIRDFHVTGVQTCALPIYGRGILAAQAIGADLAYMGTRFIATNEANASPEYKQMLVDTAASDIVYSSLFTGVRSEERRVGKECRCWWRPES